MRLVVPRTLTSRGAGLGNELIPWAKAWLAAEALGARALHPAWGLNARGYWRYFGTSRADVVTNRAWPRLLPSRRFTQADYRATGRIDFGDAVAAWARAEGLAGRRHLALEVEGMWGGFLAIRRARDFIRGQLLAARHSRENLDRVARALPPGAPRVGVHVRRGDFLPEGAAGGHRGRFNVSLPLAWYHHACEEVRRALGGDARFVLVSDDRSDEVRRLAERFGMATTWHLRHTDVSDLLTLAESDVVVCSVSTYSVVAAWLSGARYVWYRDHLQEHAGGALSIWGHEETGDDGPTARNVAALARRPAGSVRPRGVPLGASDALPAWFADPPERDDATDLILYGAVPALAG